MFQNFLVALGGGGGYTLINVSHNEKLKEDEMIMEKFDLENHLGLIHYSICEKEGDYRGNIPFWTTMLQKSLIMPRGLKFKNALGDFKIRFIRSCKRRKAFFTKKIKVDINETH
ncbi:cell surface protein [Campylobacter upsaliensis]|uniref:cell surface protein n=1 Tax=Campylobacter upsaliensis TaxID=28080 RepID=UPI002B3857D2|nr:cell surface protein [Campylobacter upsaliensis]MEB2833094.1 cell surface protein [Campylobacter upsaliensis]